MGNTEWSGTPYTAAAKERSIREARDRIAQEHAEEDDRARRCRCERPVPGRVYLAVALCAWCQRLIV